MAESHIYLPRVGGQLYIANSTALTGSQHISASATTMSVVNVGGFTGSYGNGAGEILSLKKVTSTGFSTEYVKVDSLLCQNRCVSPTSYPWLEMVAFQKNNWTFHISRLQSWAVWMRSQVLCKSSPRHTFLVR